MPLWKGELSSDSLRGQGAEVVGPRFGSGVAGALFERRAAEEEDLEAFGDQVSSNLEEGFDVA